MRCSTMETWATCSCCGPPESINKKKKGKVCGSPACAGCGAQPQRTISLSRNHFVSKKNSHETTTFLPGVVRLSGPARRRHVGSERRSEHRAGLQGSPGSQTGLFSCLPSHKSAGRAHLPVCVMHGDNTVLGRTTSSLHRTFIFTFYWPASYYISWQTLSICS